MITFHLPLLFTFLVGSDGVNFDARFSLVKEGKPGSYFGYSVAQHQITDGNGQVEKQVLLIGAPKEVVTTDFEDKTIDPIGGALFKCDAQTADTSCEMVKNSGVTYAPDQSENVTDQWFGVSVSTSGKGGHAMSCSHRYIKDNAVTGRCNVLSNKLDRGAGQNGGQQNPIQGANRVTTKFMEDFGMSQAGISAEFGKKNDIVIGAPGSTFWRGTLFKNPDYMNKFDTEWSFSPYEENGDNVAATGRYSYNGYAVAIGNFASTGPYEVSGAPRGGSRDESSSQQKSPKIRMQGQVVLYQQSSGNDNSYLEYKKEWILTGPRDFSGFGASLMVEDLNNDGLDDLVVGAPYYYEDNEVEKRYYGGAFYVYFGKDNIADFVSQTPVEVKSRSMSQDECRRLGCQHAAFSLALARLGDVNMDGFYDFAVGAPYEGDGTIYIYHGSKDGFNQKYVQRISADDISSKPLKSFGYSIAGGMDLDNNGYNDILVGAYESDKVVLIRSRPIVYLHTSVVHDPKDIDQDNPVCTYYSKKYPNNNCFKVQLCANFTSNPMSSIKDQPKVTFQLAVEENRQIPRMELEVDASEKVNLVNNGRLLKNQILDLEMDGSNNCITHYGIVKGKDNFQDRYHPIQLTYTFELKENAITETGNARGIIGINRHPKLVIASGQESIVAEVPFVRDCQGECNSNIEVQTKLKESPFSDLKKDASGVYELVANADTMLFVNIKIENTKEPAYGTYAYVKVPSNMTYAGQETSTGVYCQKEGKDENLVYKCQNIGNPLRSGTVVAFDIKFRVQSEMIGNTVHKINVTVKTESNEETPENDIKIMEFKVVEKAEIYIESSANPDFAIQLKGKSKEEASIKNEEDIGQFVIHEYTIKNRGPSTVKSAEVFIEWPYAVATKDGDKHLLQIMGTPKFNGRSIVCAVEAIQNYTKYEENPVDPAVKVVPVPKRRRRNAENRARRSKGSYQTLSCDHEKIRCFTMKCQISNLKAEIDKATITMESRLWESTMLKYFGPDTVVIESSGEVRIDASLQISQDENDDQTTTRTTVTFKKTLVQAVQWWIILVAVLAGLVLLLVVVLILYKIGFFKRKRQEDMKLYQAEKKQQGMLTEIDDDY